MVPNPAAPLENSNLNVWREGQSNRLEQYMGPIEYLLLQRNGHRDGNVNPTRLDAYSV